MITRLDAPLKVTGGAKYGADHTFPGMVYGYVLLSTIAHGEIEAVDAAPRPPVSVIDRPTSVLKTAGAVRPGRSSSARRMVVPATPPSSGAEAGDAGGPRTSTSGVEADSATWAHAGAAPSAIVKNGRAAIAGTTFARMPGRSL